MQEENLENFLSPFGDDFYNGENAIRQAFRRRSCFNTYSTEDPLK